MLVFLVSENFESPKINSHKKDWFHPEVDRVVSKQRILFLWNLLNELGVKR